jgi:hypothetical protein
MSQRVSRLGFYCIDLIASSANARADVVCVSTTLESLLDTFDPRHLIGDHGRRLSNLRQMDLRLWQFILREKWRLDIPKGRSLGC